MNEIKQTTTVSPEQLKDIIANGKTDVYGLLAGTVNEWVVIDAQLFYDNVLSAPMHLQKRRTYEVIHHPASAQLYIHAVNERIDETLSEMISKNVSNFLQN